MATTLIMPKLGMAMKEGVLGKWVKNDGDTVAVEEIIAVIVTKKITYELKAPAAGILKHIVREEDTRKVGAVIGFILEPGEAVPEVEDIEPSEMAVTEVPKPSKAAVPAKAEAAVPTAQPGGFVVATPAARRMARDAGIDLSFVTPAGAGGRVTEDDVRQYQEALAKVSITPSARKLAEEHKLDITRIQGSGPGGRITEEDIQAAIAPPPAAAGAGVPFTGMRAAIAENMVSSLQTMAQVTIFTEVDVTELVALRERLKKDFDLTYTDLIVKGVTIALRKHPRVNATLSGDTIELIEDINVGVGVALEEGLIVPVIRNADRLSIQQIGEAVRNLAAKARSDSLDIDEVTGGTFTITNLGAYGVDGFTPVINPPEVAILGVGRIVEKVVVYRGDVARRMMMVLSLTFDHRLIDGAPAAMFLHTLSETLTYPYFLGA